MSELFQERFDDFQKEAVVAIERDFRAKVNGRFLLVIPTGGGKTFTAVKAINQLFEHKILDPSCERVLWVAHRTELIGQAEETFDRFTQQYPDKDCFKSNID